MNLYSDVNRVKMLIKRYFLHPPHVTQGFIGHAGDCAIYTASPDRRFCDCGLIHDMYCMDFTLAETLYEDYQKDLHIHQTGEESKTNREGYEDAVKLLESIFGKPAPPDEKDIKEEYDYIKKVLKKSDLFKTNAADMYTRLKKWLETELAKVKND